MHSTQRKTAIAIHDLIKIYPDGNIRAVDGVSLDINKGEIFTLLGPNGAGKSTTIGIIGTSLSPTGGSVSIFGYDVISQPTEVRKYIGICPQELVFYENLTVFENLMFFGSMYNRPAKTLKEYANFLISHVGLDDKRKILAKKLSGGMKRRLNLIIALVNDPDLLILDEPTAGLDPQTRHLVWDFLQNLKKKGKTIFLTTHYMDEADILSDRVAIIDHGKIIALDSPFDLKRQYSGGDLIELKFQESDEMVQQKFAELNGTSIFKDIQYIEEDNLFRIAIHEGLLTIGSLLEAVSGVKLHITDMNIKANTLENVFITLTGRGLRN